MLKALSNVAPRHLLDTRLNPPAIFAPPSSEVRLDADAPPEVRCVPAPTREGGHTDERDNQPGANGKPT